MEYSSPATLRSERNFRTAREVALREVVGNVGRENASLFVEQVKGSHVAADTCRCSLYEATNNCQHVGRIRDVFHSGHQELRIVKLHNREYTGILLP